VLFELSFRMSSTQDVMSVVQELNDTLLCWLDKHKGENPSHPAHAQKVPTLSGTLLKVMHSTALHLRDEKYRRKVESSREKVLLIIERLLRLLVVSGLKLKSCKSWIETARSWLLLDLDDNLEKFLKWKFAYVAAWLLKQSEFAECPKFWLDDRGVPMDKGHVLVGGEVYTFFRRARQACPLKRMSLAQTVLNFKKAMPAVSDEFLKRTIQSSGEQLIKPLELPPDVDYEDTLWGIRHDCACQEERCQCWEFSLPSLSFEVDRTARELFRGKQFRMEQKFLKPSERGHFECNRGNGGAAVAAAEMLRRNRRWFSAQVFAPQEEHIQQEVHYININFLGAEHAMQEMPAELVGLKEPFKVRVISKGPAKPYYLSRYLQKFLWKVMKQNPSMRLIGEPISADLLSDRLGGLQKGEVWVSGDYQSATDFLHPVLCESAINAIVQCSGLTSGWAELFRKALTGHTIYRKDEDIKARLGPQRWGQLMGSPLSFPILCLINAAITRRVMEVSERRVMTLAESRLVVNGDDIGFPIKEEDYDMWSYATRKGGLVKSVGKNYTSRDFIVLNSMMYHYSTFQIRLFDEVSLRFGQSEHKVWDPVPFLNGALLFGLKPKGDFDQGANVGAIDLLPGVDTSLQARQRTMLEQARGYFDRKVLDTEFIRSHKPLLDKLPPGMDWVMPPALGGLGLDLIDKRPSLGARKIAALLMECSEEQYSFQRRIFFAPRADESLLRACNQMVALEGVRRPVQEMRDERGFLVRPESQDVSGYMFNAVLDCPDAEKYRNDESEETLWRRIRNGYARLLRLALGRSRHTPGWRTCLAFKPVRYETVVEEMAAPPVIRLEWELGVPLD